MVEPVDSPYCRQNKYVSILCQARFARSFEQLTPLLSVMFRPRTPSVTPPVWVPVPIPAPVAPVAPERAPEAVEPWYDMFFASSLSTPVREPRPEPAPAQTAAALELNKSHPWRDAADQATHHEPVTCSQSSSSCTNPGPGADASASAGATAAGLCETSTAGLQDERDFPSVSALLVSQLHLELSRLDLVQDAVSRHAEQPIRPRKAIAKTQEASMQTITMAQRATQRL